jgi:exosortase family protein XrtG
MTITPLQTTVFALAWAALTFVLWSRRRWLVYYITGAFGLVLVVLFAAQAFGLDGALEALQARQVVGLAEALGMDISLLSASGLAIKNHVGWAVFDIGVECSAILEMATFAGLTAFYPAFRIPRRAFFIAIGVAATYVLNLARILLIVAIIDAGGTSWVFSAHAVFGRLFFFAGVIAIFWYLITRPTIGVISGQLEAVPE